MSARSSATAEPSPPFVVTLAATLLALPPAQERLAGFLRASGVPERTVGRAELLLEELVANVISHGELAAPKSAALSLEAEIEPDGACRLTFEDPGRPFDPVSAGLPGQPSRLEEARIGGLGLVLLRRMARELIYLRLPDGRNRLTFWIGPDPAG